MLKHNENCPDFNELMRWVRGELPSNRSDIIRSHVHICKTCASHVLAATAFHKIGKQGQPEPSATATTGCLDDSILIKFVNGKSLGNKKRKQVIEHLAQCNRCRLQSAALFREIKALNSPQPESIARLHAKKNWRQWFRLIYQQLLQPPHLRWAYAGMALILIISGALFISYNQQNDSAIWLTPSTAIREANHSTTRRFKLRQPENGQFLNKNEAIRFAWPPIPQAQKYILILYTADGEVLWEHAAESTQVDFDGKTLLKSGEKYYWRVEAGTGTTRPCLSETRSFSVR